MNSPRASWAPHRARPLWQALVLLVVVSGCVDASGGEWYDAPQSIAHPVADQLLSSNASVPIRVIRFDDPPSEVSPWIAAFTGADTATTIGVLEGPSELTFGRLVDAVVFPDRRFAVLDPSYGVVRLFSEAGVPLGTLGRPGDGPGELADPVALVADGPSVSVASQAGSRLERFTDPFGDLGGPENGRRSIDLISLRDACLVGGDVVAMGVNLVGNAADERTDGGYLHAVDSAGSVSHSFAAPYDAPGIDVLATYSDQLAVACVDGREGGIWAAYGMLGEVHAFDSEGELRWIARLDDLVFPDLIEVPGEAIGLHPEQRGLLEYISGLSVLDDSVLAVQVTSTRRASSGSAESSDSFRTYLLNLTSGEYRGGAEGSFQVLGAGFGRSILYREMPHPSLMILGVDPQ